MTAAVAIEAAPSGLPSASAAASVPVAEAEAPRAAARSRPAPGLARDLVALLKPRIALASGAAAWVGFRVAGGDGIVAGAAVGGATAAVAGGACCLNMWLERDLDARMVRTRERPLPAGRIRPGAALAFGSGVALAGLAALLVQGQGGPLAALLALATVVLYVAVYTPLKRLTPVNTLVGAVPGALPVVVGWAAAGGGLAVGAAALFAILYLWQLPHFLAIASLYRDDYARAGMPMLPVVDRGGDMVGRQAVLYAAYLLAASLAPWGLGLAGGGYLVVAVGLGLVYLLASASLLVAPSARAARRVFACSLIYLVGAFAALWLDALRVH